MPDLRIELKISLDEAPKFYRWLPLSPEDAIAIDDGDLHLRLEIRLDSVAWGSNRSLEQVQNTSNNPVHVIFVLVSVDIDANVSDLVRADPNSFAAGEGQYKELGNRIQTAVVTRVNRFIDFVRSEKGQYLIEPLSIDLDNPSQFFIRNEAAATIDGRRVLFDPDRRTFALRVDVQMGDPAKMITEMDWPSIQDFVRGSGRTKLTNSLLADARTLAAQGKRRNALVEAVSALEVALSRFAQNVAPEVQSRISADVEAGHMRSLIEKLGLRGSFGVAIPLIFSRNEFAADVLERCREAIEQRNNIVHNGARDVDGAKLPGWISRIEEACHILDQYTVKKADG